MTSVFSTERALYLACGPCAVESLPEQDRPCSRPDCDSPLDESKRCEDCSRFFCGLHLYESPRLKSLCLSCYCLDERLEAASEALLEAECVR